MQVGFQDAAYDSWQTVFIRPPVVDRAFNYSGRLKSDIFVRIATSKKYCTKFLYKIFINEKFL